MAQPKSKQVYYSVFINGDAHTVTGRKRTPAGYVALCIKAHPNSDKTNGYIFEHRIVMESYLGRYLEENEIVHHINEKKHDNRIENLEIMERGEHTRLHHKDSKRSEEVKGKISRKMLERCKDKENHPNYKWIDKEEFIHHLRMYGPTKTSNKLNISRRTVYNKIKEFNLEECIKNVK